MPHIGAVMERSLVEPQSLGEALRGLLARSVMAAMTKPGDKRSISDSITDVKTAFSSWDNCMQAVYCKWPVIAIIVVGGLILLSILWCIIRCACCGLSCCCECCYCLKCCGQCCGCCDPPNKKKYLDEPYIPPHHDQAYHSEAPMTAARAVPSYQNAEAKPEPPQYAEFDMSKKGGGDALPAMPSWDGANSKKVLLEEEDDDAVELEQLKKPDAGQSTASLNAVGSMSNSSQSQFGAAAGAAGAAGVAGVAAQAGANGYRMPPSRSATDPYGANGNGYNNYGNGGAFNQPRDQANQGYGNQAYGAQGYGNQGYGAAGGAMGQEQNPYGDDYNNNNNNNAAGYGRGPAGPAGPNQGYPPRGARSYDDYGRNVTPRMGTPGNAGAYGRPAPTASPAPYGPGAYGNPAQTQSPAPSQGGYGYGQRTNTPNSYGRQYPPNPQRQFSGESAPPNPRRQFSGESAPPNPQRQYSGDTAPVMDMDPPQQYGQQRSHTPNSYGRQYPPNPQRQYSADAASPTDYEPQYANAHTNPLDVDSQTSPIQNSGGFDFTSGFSRPGTTPPASTPSPAPGQTPNGGAAYPGYRAYKPAQ